MHHSLTPSRDFDEKQQAFKDLYGSPYPVQQSYENVELANLSPEQQDYEPVESANWYDTVSEIPRELPFPDDAVHDRGNPSHNTSEANTSFNFNELVLSPYTSVMSYASMLDESADA